MSAAAVHAAMNVHAFTVDLEDWYQGIPIDAAAKTGAARRLEVGTDFLLNALARHQVRGTFFVLQNIALEYPQLLRRISNAGHEIGSHGLSHDLIYEMSPARFREETRASIRSIEDCIGKSVCSYRAAYFSITKKSLWAFDILAAEGIRFDSSIFPVKNWRYGIPDYSRMPVVVETAHGPILEFPITTRRVFNSNIPISGGAYFRIYPYWLTRANFRSSERAGMPVVFYLHPWELDPDHPRVPFERKARLTHYVNISSTRGKLERVFRDFRFSTLSEVLSATCSRLGAKVL